MSNEINMHRYITIIGFVLLLISLFFLPFRIERLLEKRADLICEMESGKALEHFQSEEHRFLKGQMTDLNEVVAQTNNQITALIDHTSLVNDSINKLMTRVLNESHLLDTIQELYNRGILADEIKIDSLNRLFTNQSNRLIEKIRMFNQEDRDLKIIQSGIHGKNLKKSYITISILVHFIIFAIAFTGGIIFFIRGLKKWKLSLRKIQDSGVDL